MCNAHHEWIRKENECLTSKNVNKNQVRAMEDAISDKDDVFYVTLLLLVDILQGQALLLSSAALQPEKEPMQLKSPQKNEGLPWIVKQQAIIPAPSSNVRSLS